MRKWIVQRQALEDVEVAAQFLADAAGAHHVDRFREELTALLRTLCEFPGVGTPCPDTPLGLTDLRRARVRRYQHLIYYTADDKVLTILRVLHPKRDLDDELSS